jgi:hypothetical protein
MPVFIALWLAVCLVGWLACRMVAATLRLLCWLVRCVLRAL